MEGYDDVNNDRNAMCNDFGEFFRPKINHGRGGKWRWLFVDIDVGLLFMVQVTCEYYFSKGACVPSRVHTVVVSVQHSDKITLEDLRRDVMEKVVKAVIPEKYLDERTVYHINPCGQFVLGGPQVDMGSVERMERLISSFPAAYYRCAACVGSVYFSIIRRRCSGRF